ncbi:uncharacterized protein [Dendrobates tinctorius]|uniref:uncharacterized protein n=1 Tax=Dendrobates tinctorius TaxID=92724 RepID=UPI003CC9D090
MAVLLQHRGEVRVFAVVQNGLGPPPTYPKGKRYVPGDRRFHILDPDRWVGRPADAPPHRGSDTKEKLGCGCLAPFDCCPPDGMRRCGCWGIGRLEWQPGGRLSCTRRRHLHIHGQEAGPVQSQEQPPLIPAENFPMESLSLEARTAGRVEERRLREEPCGDVTEAVAPGKVRVPPALLADSQAAPTILPRHAASSVSEGLAAEGPMVYAELSEAPAPIPESSARSSVTEDAVVLPQPVTASLPEPAATPVLLEVLDAAYPAAAAMPALEPAAACLTGPATQSSGNTAAPVRHPAPAYAGPQISSSASAPRAFSAKFCPPDSGTGAAPPVWVAEVIKQKKVREQEVWSLLHKKGEAGMAVKRSWGRLVYTNVDREYGLICDKTGQKVYVNVASIWHGQALKEGDLVSYYKEYCPRGYYAVAVLAEPEECVPL